MGRRPRSSPGTREACTWRRGPASRQCGQGNARRPPVNTDELEYAMYGAERRVLEIQAKLHRWAGEDPHRRFDDLFVRHEAPECRAGVEGPGRRAVAAARRS